MSPCYHYIIKLYIQLNSRYNNDKNKYKNITIVFIILASSRCLVSWGTVQETVCEKIKKRSGGSKRTPVSKLNKRSFLLYQDLVYRYPLIGPFYQHSSITDADAIWWQSETFQRVTRCSKQLQTTS